jgi:hypothetical protein
MPVKPFSLGCEFLLFQKCYCVPTRNELLRETAASVRVCCLPADSLLNHQPVFGTCEVLRVVHASCPTGTSYIHRSQGQAHHSTLLPTSTPKWGTGYLHKNKVTQTTLLPHKVVYKNQGMLTPIEQTITSNQILGKKKKKTLKGLRFSWNPDVLDEHRIVLYPQDESSGICFQSHAWTSTEHGMIKGQTLSIHENWSYTEKVSPFLLYKTKWLQPS